MTESRHELVMISGPKAAIEALHREVGSQPGSEGALTEQKNLDGASPTWLLIANLAVAALPPILTFIKDMVAQRSVTKIRLGDIEIENPTAEDIERLRKSLAARTRSDA